MPDDMPCANPLLLKWVEEWLEVERLRGSRGVKTYQKARDAIRACPLTFAHPSEAKQLNGIGDLLVKRLTQRMEEFCEANGLPKPKIPKGKKRTLLHEDGSNEEEDATSSPKKRKKITKPYVPKLRSGAYAIMIALSSMDEDDESGLSKDQVVAIAEEHSDSSFTKPKKANEFYTAWNSMQTLLDKNLVYSKGKLGGKRYLLTPDGWDIARGLRQAISGGIDNLMHKDSVSPQRRRKGNPQANASMGLIASGSPHHQESGDGLSETMNLQEVIPRGNSKALPTFEPIVIPPEAYSIHLVLDNREVRAKNDRTHMQMEFEKRGITPITRSLELGDVTWIAKVHNSKLLSSLGGTVDEGDEVILDWIVERKRLDDLIGSIKDGRFHEQKFRMRKSGMKNAIYIIEEHNVDSQVLSNCLAMIESAKTSIQVVDGYFLKETKSMDDTMKYLTMMTNMLRNEVYRGKELYVIPSRVITATNYLPLNAHLRKTKPGTDFHITYSAFGALFSKSKSDTLRDVYMKMLMCTRGVTGEKALEMQRIWNTPIELVEAYQKCGEGEDGKKNKMQLVSDRMGNMIARKKIQRALSVGISKVWGDMKIDGDH
ncbi:putative DNA repair protein Mus81 [Bisporella sp. PMI_857]|nr:putative DNA repair protein Mus81 [Bisporella sp. PMI_857]